MFGSSIVAIYRARLIELDSGRTARITVLVAGAVLTEGSPHDIRADARVRAVYLGEEFPHG